MSSKHLVVGRITRSHGLKGQVEIASLSDFPGRFARGASFRLFPPTAERDTIVIEQAVQKNARVLATIAGCRDRGAAELLVGKTLLISETEGAKPPGAYWHHQIIGCQVITVDGQELGPVIEIIRTGGNDVYVVTKERRYLVPAVKEVIKKIDLEEEIIIIQPIEGLLDL